MLLIGFGSHFFLMDPSQKLMTAFQPMVHWLLCPASFRQPSWNMTVYGSVPKKYILEE